MQTNGFKPTNSTKKIQAALQAHCMDAILLHPIQRTNGSYFIIFACGIYLGRHSSFSFFAMISLEGYAFVHG